MNGEIKNIDVLDIKNDITDGYKNIKPEKEMSLKEMNDVVSTEFDKASKDFDKNNKESELIHPKPGDIVYPGVDPRPVKPIRPWPDIPDDLIPVKPVWPGNDPKLVDQEMFYGDIKLGKNDNINNEKETKVTGDNEVNHSDNQEVKGLTEEEKEKIKDETGWSDEIIDYIKNMEQYEIYKNADLVETEINGRKCLVKKNLDMDYVSEKTKDDEHPDGISNRELMANGRSPYDSKTGEKLELHHMGQEADSPFAELCENSEHGDGNSSILHDNDKPSWRRDPEAKNYYNNVEKPKHWEERSKE